jgi:membrane associated rhomboid family serine protease
MRIAQVHGPMELDACQPCGLFWFDAGELGSLPVPSPLPVGHALPPPKPDFERIRKERLEAAERTPIAPVPEAMTLEGGAPDTALGLVLTLLGMPLEENAPTKRRVFWATWLVLAGMVLTMAWTWGRADVAAKAWGFLPSDPLRHGGLTLATSFFLHAGLWHLLGNGYFLLVFGDNVEDLLGPVHFLLLLCGAALTGSALHVLFDHSPNLPCVGASGGISGVMAFYAAALPEARIRLFLGRLWLGGWLCISARTAFGLWILVQLLGAWLQVLGFGHVSYLAHLGGAVLGLGWWACWRWVRSDLQSGAARA